MNETLSAVRPEYSGSRIKKNRGVVGRFFYELLRNKFMYALALPGMIWFFVFAYLPMGGIVIAFQDFNVMKGITGSKFVGLKNFEFFFRTNDWIKVVSNTLFLNILFIAIGTIAAVAIAIMVTEIGGKTFKKVTQSVMIFPNFLSWTVVAMFMTAFVATDGGFLNQILGVFGIRADHFLVVAAILACHFGAAENLAWRGIWLYHLHGHNCRNQPGDLRIRFDGRRQPLQKIRFITLPLLKPTIILLTILAVGGIFNGDFGLIYAIIGRNPLLYPTTDVIDTYVFRALIGPWRFGDGGRSRLFAIVHRIRACHNRQFCRQESGSGFRHLLS